jgi:hypothetical protein
MAAHAVSKSEIDAPALNVEQIANKIIRARAEIAEREAEERDLALAAVSGDEKAVARIAEIRATIRRIEADISLLENARFVAQRNEALADAEKLQAYRDRHFQIAKERATAIVNLATVIDGLVDDLKARITNMNQIEKEIFSALRQAGSPPETHIVGRIGLGQSAVDRLSRFTSGTDKFRQGRSVSAVARSAWGYLLTDKG